MRAALAVVVVLALAACRSTVSTSVAPSPRRALDLPVACGAARVPLPVEAGWPLGGYRARNGAANQGQRDPVYARAIVLEAGDVRVAIASVDLLLISADLRAHVVDDLGGLRLDGFLLAATHDHSGPGGYYDNALAEWAALGDFDARRRDAIARAIADAVRNALAAVRPARFRCVSDALPQWQHNRRHDDGPTDPVFVAAQWRDEDGRSIATITSFAAHPTVMGPDNMLVSGEFPGALCRRVEATTGGVALFLNAAAGDQGPVGPEGPGDRGDLADRLGEKLAQVTLERLSTTLDQPCETLAAARATLRLAPKKPRSTFGWSLGPLAVPIVALWTPRETTLGAIAVGPLRFVGFPCDFGAGLGPDTRALRPARFVVPVSYADDYIGYAVDERNYWRGGYEPMLSFYGPRLGDDLVDTAGLLLDALPP